MSGRREEKSRKGFKAGFGGGWAVGRISERAIGKERGGHIVRGRVNGNVNGRMSGKAGLDRQVSFV